MAPTPRPRRHPSPPPRPLTLALTLLPLLLASPSLSSTAPSPSPSPSPAPVFASQPNVTPTHSGHQPPHHPPKKPSNRRLNFGERVGIALAGVAMATQVVLGAFLAARAWQLRRLEKAEVSSSTPLT